MRAGSSQRPLRGRAIGVYGSAGAPWHHLALAAAFGAEVRPVRAQDIAAGRLDELDAFVVPGGGAFAMAGMLAPLGPNGATAIRRWVEEGGTYISSCAGSVLPLALEDEAAKALPVAACLRMTDLGLANPGDATLGGLASPGVGRLRVRVDPSHPFARGLPESVELVHYNGPLFDVAAAPGAATAFAWPIEPLSGFTPAERFMAPSEPTVAEVHAGVRSDPENGAAGERARGDHERGGGAAGGADPADDDLTIAKCIRLGAATGVASRYGAGRLVLFGSHPEFGLGPLALGWGAGSRLLVSALRGDDVGRPGRRDPGPATSLWEAAPAHGGKASADLADSAVREMLRGAERFAALAQRDAGAWLDAGAAPALNGRSARDAWRVDGTFAAAALAAAADDLEAFADRLGAAERPWLDDAPRDDQDFGWMGLTQLLERMHAMLHGAERNLSQPPQRPAHAYDLFDTHPFHLAVGTYLSAAGLAAAATLTTVVLASRAGAAAPASDLVLWTREGQPVAT